MKEWNVGDITEVQPNVFGKILNQYENGYETTAGFVRELNINNNMISITYDSDHAEQLPFGWTDMLWLDDHNKRQHIKDIVWDNRKGSLPLYLMEDDSYSWTVTY